jgi:hypothetical protein
MKYKELLLITQDYNARMTKDSSFSVPEFIQLAKIWNTIPLFGLEQKDDSFKTFNKLFFPKYVNEAASHLGALPDKGMSLYSKKYDLYIGGRPHENSHYKIIF